MLLAMTLLTALVRGDIDTTVHLPRNGTVDITSQNGDINVHSVSGDVVTVHGGNADVDGERVEVHHGGRHHDYDDDGTISVGVPAYARVEVHTTSGTITINGVTERLEAETVNGEIVATGIGGDVTLTAVAGDITVHGFQGTRLALNGTSDDIKVTDATGAIDAENVNGAVKLMNVRSSSVTATTINDDVSYGGEITAGGNYTFSSQNGDVTLMVPRNLSARLRVSTLNGDLNTEIPGTTTGSNTQGTDDRGGKAKFKAHDGEHTIVVVYGSGSATIDVDAYNGDINVKERP